MNVQRFQRLHACRIFRNFNWPEYLEEFSRFNLIFGLNGSGKTTLSTLFRGMEIGEKLVDGECELKVDSHPLDISGPSTKTPNLRVFNKDTVSDSVFKLPGSTHLPPVYVIGEKNVEIGKQVKTLIEQLRDARINANASGTKLTNLEAEFERFCADHARDIKNLLTKAGGGPYNNYDKSRFKAKVRDLLQMEALPAELSEEAFNKLLSMRESSQMAPIDELNQDFPHMVELTRFVREALAKSVTSSIIQKLADDPDLARWVATGLELHRKEAFHASCLFCGQTIPRGRITQLEGHFNDEFSRFEAGINNLLERVESMHDNIKALNPPEKGALYGHLATEYAKVRQNFVDQRKATLSYLNLLRKAIIDKKNQPFSVLNLNSYLSPDPNDNKSHALITLLNVILSGVVMWTAHSGADAFKTLADLIQKHNAYSKHFEEDIEKARQELEQDIVVKAMPGYRKLATDVDFWRQTVATDQNNVSNLQGEITRLEAQMRGYLEPAAKLTADLADYLGHKELVFEVHDTGYTISRDGIPAAHLSEGERTAVAFLYFLRSLEDASVDLRNTIIVVDDPASSLDEGSIYSAFGYMKQHTQTAAQLFVLTHNFRFFSLTRNWFKYEPRRDRRFYMLQSTFINGHRNSKITKLDKLLAEHESDYHYVFKMIRKEAAIAEEGRELASYYAMPNLVRKMLDCFLAYRCPSQTSLHSKINSIKQFSLARRTRLVRFAEFHSHTDEAGVTGHDASILAETPKVLQDVLDFIKTADEDHYNQMMAVTNEE